LGGAADVLVSGTVRDLMTGSRVTLEDLGTHDLKGVPEARAVFRVREIDGRAVAGPLTPEVVAARLAAIEPLAKRRRPVALVAGGAGMLVVQATVLLVTQGSGSSTAPPPG